MASPNLTELVTTTLRNRGRTLYDNMLDNNALFSWMKQRGNAMMVSGGRDLVEELEYEENSTFMFYSGYEILNIEPSDTFTAAVFDWKQSSVSVTISGLEGTIQNAGKERQIALLASRIRNAEKTMMNQMAISAYSNGTGFNGKEIGGLQLLVADTPTSGIVGGINRANWSFWQNQIFRTSTDGGGNATKSNIRGYMSRLYNNLTRGKDRPGLIVADGILYTIYEESLHEIQRINSAEEGKSGFTTLRFKGNTPVILDGGVGGACPSRHMYFLNPDYIRLKTASDRNMVPVPAQSSINQDASVTMILWAGNMTLSNAFLQGVLYDD